MREERRRAVLENISRGSRVLVPILFLLLLAVYCANLNDPKNTQPAGQASGVIRAVYTQDRDHRPSYFLYVVTLDNGSDVHARSRPNVGLAVGTPVILDRSVNTKSGDEKYIIVGVAQGEGG